MNCVTCGHSEMAHRVGAGSACWASDGRTRTGLCKCSEYLSEPDALDAVIDRARAITETVEGISDSITTIIDQRNFLYQRLKATMQHYREMGTNFVPDVALTNIIIDYEERWPSK